jgi:hypothetical protein
MRLKLDNDGHVVTAGGHPVYVHADGREAPFDAAAAVTRAERAERAVVDEKVSSAFHRSTFVTEKLVVPPDMAAATFGAAFKIEDGKLVAYDKAGVKIYSRQRIGEAAEVDEAVERLVAGHPEKDRILKAPGASSHGRKTGAGAVPSSGSALSRTAFERLSAEQRMTYVKAGGALVEA